MIEKSKMKDLQIHGEIHNYIGNADIYEAFDTLDEAGEGQVKFGEFVRWVFDKNMVIEMEKEKERETKLELTEAQEVES